MKTVERVKELAAERNLSLNAMCKQSGLPYSTIKNTELRCGQLSVDTIEIICRGLGITMSEFFKNA